MNKSIDITMILPTDHSKIAHTLKFNLHTEPGHGWLAVKKCLIYELGLAGKISAWSYMQGKSAYLEEDNDVPKFIKAFTEKFGIQPTIVELKQRDDSPIRYFKNFKMEV